MGSLPGSEPWLSHLKVGMMTSPSTVRLREVALQVLCQGKSTPR